MCTEKKARKTQIQTKIHLPFTKPIQTLYGHTTNNPCLDSQELPHLHSKPQYLHLIAETSQHHSKAYTMQRENPEMTIRTLHCFYTITETLKTMYSL